MEHRLSDPHELYGRLVFNILCGNTDDHARNHAGLWDGEHLTLTPAYDICPQSRSGNVASQAMLIVGDNRMSTLATCLEAVPNFQLSERAAKDIIARQIGAIPDGWEDICEEAVLTRVERNLFGQRILLNGCILEGTAEGLRRWRLHRGRAEALYALIANKRGSESGVAGIEWAQRTLDANNTGSIDFATTAEPGSETYYLKKTWGIYRLANRSQLFETDSMTAEDGARQLLIVGHVPSGNTRRLRDAAAEAARGAIEGDSVRVVVLSPFETRPAHVLAADAVILGTTENLGYMSGALKDFFDRCYYPCLDHTQGLPYCLYIRAGHDGTGARRGVETIVTGLRWRAVQEPVICRGAWDEAFADRVAEIGAAMTAGLEAGIF